MPDTTTVDPTTATTTEPITTAAPSSPTPTDWRAGLTGEHAPLAQEKALESFKGKDWTEVGPALAKAFVETKKLVGAKAAPLTIPGEGASAEEVAAYRKAIGVPDTPAEYQLRVPELPPGEQWTDEVQTKFLTRLHALGTPPHIVQAFVDLYAQHMNEVYNGFRREAEATGQELRRDWGPNYDANLGRANRAIQAYGGNALVDLFAQNGMGRHPLVVRTFAKIGQDLVEHGAMEGDTIGRVTPEEAQERLKTLQADLVKQPYGSEAHAALIEQIVQYSKIAQGRS